MKSILFISWDGPQTSYMEGLFLPIFMEISENSDYCFHVIQFTWANQANINSTKEVASDYGITYTALPIQRKPNSVLGSLVTIFFSLSKLKSYIKKHCIDIVMPRSTMPAIMVNRLKSKGIKIVFDADGLPIDERVDFAGLNNRGFLYKLLLSQEKKMIRDADVVLTRTNKSITIHNKRLSNTEIDNQKFFVVNNGREESLFAYDANVRTTIRKNLFLSDSDKLFVYCGSLGDQYCVPEMLSIFEGFHLKNPGSKFLILTGSPEYLEDKIPTELKSSVVIKKVPVHEIPQYLSAADVALNLRKPTFSMQGISPIKLGEYLLMGLPTIASIGIGDTEDILYDLPNCYLFDHTSSNDSVMKAVEWLSNIDSSYDENIRQHALRYYSLKNSSQSYINALNYLKD